MKVSSLTWAHEQDGLQQGHLCVIQGELSQTLAQVEDGVRHNAQPSILKLLSFDSHLPAQGQGLAFWVVSNCGS